MHQPIDTEDDEPQAVIIHWPPNRLQMEGRIRRVGQITRISPGVVNFITVEEADEHVRKAST